MTEAGSTRQSEEAMSKELIDKLREKNEYGSLREITEECQAGAADRIEELEREIERKMSAAAFVLKERDALQADNARLRAGIADLINEVTKADNALSEGDRNKALIGVRMSATAASLVEQALAATAQSLDPYKARIAQLEAENSTLSTDFSSLRAKVFTNGDRRITLKDRTFTVEGDGLILDNNFDFDAGLRVSGDFVGDEKQQYAQMIADALNMKEPE